MDPFSPSASCLLEVRGSVLNTSAMSMLAYVPILSDRGSQPSTSGPRSNAAKPASRLGGMNSFWIKRTFARRSLPSKSRIDTNPTSTRSIQGVNIRRGPLHIEGQLVGSFGTHLLETVHGLEVRVDDNIEILDQKPVSIDDFLDESAHSDNRRNTQAGCQDVDLPVVVFLLGDDSLYVPEITFYARTIIIFKSF